MKIKKVNVIKTVLLVFAVILITVCAKSDYALYSKSIATITSVSDKYAYTKMDSEERYKEKYYTQTIRAEIKNGKYKGSEVLLSNTYSASEVYDLKYKEGDDVFIEKIHKDTGTLKATLSGLKRDYLVILAIAVFCLMFLLIGGRDGALTLVSLIMNLGAFYGVLILYFRGLTILYLTIPMVIFFAFLLLVFINGFSKITWISFFSSISVVLLTGMIAYFAMHFSTQPDYDFLEYLIQPYNPRDARDIFLSEILVGCMGAVMDVSITVIITLSQIAKNNNRISNREMFLSAKTVGDDVIGTMIPVMFFTNIAIDIPFFILSLRNAMTLHSILRYHCFFSAARFLTGSIAIVLAVPISAAITILILRKKGHRHVD